MPLRKKTLKSFFSPQQPGGLRK
uniref:Uncharacterized protein n=1 Tax=Rhizophora mucronata TaxID=61149 RepID=A0A2P2QUQ4_RHIMU